MDVFGSITSVIGLVKKAKDLADQLKNLELKAVLVELQGQLLDVKTECLKYREELETLKAENKRLSAPPEMVVAEGLYYKKEGDGPFCTACYDTKAMVVRLGETPSMEQEMLNMNWQCPSCNARFR